MIDINKYLVICAAVMASLTLFAAQAQAQAQAKANVPLVSVKKERSPAVVRITKSVGRVLVELPNGQRMPLKSGVLLPEDARILAWSKSSVEGIYTRTKCRFRIEPKLSAGSTLNIRDDKQCAAAIAVINPDKYSGFLSSSNPGCCVVRTITTTVPAPSTSGCCIVRPATPAELSSLTSTSSTSALSSVRLPAAVGAASAGLPAIPSIALGPLAGTLGSLAAVALLVGDSDTDNPVSPQ